MEKQSNQFVDLTPQEWKLKVQAELAGLDYNQVLVWDTAEGIQVKPVYTTEDLPEHVSVDFTQKDWKIIGNYVTCADQDDSYLYGWNLKDDQFEQAKNLPQYLDLFYQCQNPVLFLQNDFSKISNLQYLGFDPIGNLVQNGNWIESEENTWRLAKQAANNPALTKALLVDVSIYQNAGANHVQQIAYALASANELIQKLGAEVADKIYFKVAVGGNYFFEIAKLKSLRKLWKLILNEYQIDSEPFIYAENSLRNKSVLDIQNNIIRSSLEASSAILGKADVVSIFAYDQLSGSSPFSEELASKQQLLLQKESYYDKFHDPIAGSYFIENLIELLSKNALDLFKKIESDGGFLVEILNGNIQKSIQKSADKEQLAFDEGKLVLIGVNKFQNKNEKLDALPVSDNNLTQTIVQTIVPKRLASKIEQSIV